MEDTSGTDDIFADSSTETVKENVTHEECKVHGLLMGDSSNYGFKSSCKEIASSDTANAAHGSVVAIRVIEDYCRPSHILYCPFCPMSFTSDQLLKNHLKDFHKSHMNFIFSDDKPIITLQSCILCHAKFYSRGLLPLHLLKNHENALIGLINCRNTKNDDLLHCMYCNFTIMRKNSKVLMLHLEKMHFTQFENFVYNNYSATVNAKEVLSSFHDQPKFIHYSSSLHRPIKRVSFSSRGINSSARRKLDFNNLENKRKRSIQIKFSRKDRLNNDGSISLFKKKSKDKNRLTKWLFFGRGHQKSITIVTSTPKLDQILANNTNEDSSELLQYRCASCYQTFHSNKELLRHVSHFHKWPWNRIKPCYSCGFCNATFYRNSFLIRHTINHHTPKCLKVSLED